MCSLHAASIVLDSETQRGAPKSLQFGVSSMSTERLNNGLDAASRDRFCLMSGHTPADAPKRVTAGCLHPQISSMRTKRSNRGLDSSSGGSSGLAHTVQQAYVRQRIARRALDFGVEPVRRHRSDERFTGFRNERSVHLLAGRGVFAKKVANRTATICLDPLFCGVRAHGRNNGLARATVQRTFAVVCRLQQH
jgi:hypothetical protein